MPTSKQSASASPNTDHPADLPEGAASVGIYEHDSIAYLQQELAVWLQFFLERNGHTLEDAQQKALRRIVATFENHIYTLLNIHLFPNAINRYPQSDLEEFYLPNIAKTLKRHSNAHAVILDQAIYYLVHDALKAEFDGRIHELSMGRPYGNLATAAADGKVPRIGYKPLSDQVDDIKQAIGTDGQVFLVDDTTVEGGTLHAATEMLQAKDITTMPPETNLVYFLTRRPESGMQQQLPPVTKQVTMNNSAASAESREFCVFGGAQEVSFDGNARGYVVPGFLPFSNGEAIRMSKDGVALLNLPDVSLELLELNRQFITNLAGVLRLSPNQLKLSDFNLIPADAAIARSGEQVTASDDTVNINRPFLHGLVNRSLKRKAEEPLRNTNIATFLEQTPLVGYLNAAQTAVEQLPKPEIEVVCSDIDGTMAGMKAVDEKLVGFEGPLLFVETKLGELVQRNSRRAIRQLLSHGQMATLHKLNTINMEDILQQMYLWGLADRADKMFGKEAKERIREIFIDAFDEGLGMVEAEEFIKKYPRSYHALRHLTWDLPVEQIYDGNYHAQNFAQNVIRRGAELVYITAGPRIHALKMLKETGVLDNSGPKSFKLYSVEDLYEPGSIPENGQQIDPSKLLQENGKDYILNQIHQQTGIAKTHIAMGGDEYDTEVHPALFGGFAARVVKGPEYLADFARSMKLPNDDEILAGGDSLDFEFRLPNDKTSELDHGTARLLNRPDEHTKPHLYAWRKPH